jgi:uncharacterized membrane protein YesL
VASRADGTALTPAPQIGSVMRTAAVDFYYQSIRLVAANLVWGTGLLVIVFIAAASGPLVALILSPILAIPATGPFRLASLIARDEHPDFSDAVQAWRRYALLAVVLGAGLVVAGTVLLVDMFGAFRSSNPLAWTLATMAGWGLLALVTFALIAWPILTDPRRDAQPLRDRLRLAGMLLAAHPVRMAGLALLIGLILVLSTVAFAALLTISLSYVALVSARYVLPASDRLEARLNRQID